MNECLYKLELLVFTAFTLLIQKIFVSIILKLQSKDELKKIDINNHMCYYFDDIIRFWDRDINLSDILLDKKSYEAYKNILIFGILCKNSTGACYAPICNTCPNL